MKSRMALVAVFASILVLSAALPAWAGPGRDKLPLPDGRAPKKWNLTKPAVERHPDESPPTAGGNGDGRNSLSFSAFDDGDMVVALGTATGHAGCWADRRFVTLDSRCVWSANTSPVNGVQLEQPRKYQAYDYAYGLWVPSKATFGAAVVGYCATQLGEPYNISSSKTDYTRWYCSKLSWVGWKLKTGLDLDADGGYWVWPVDLVNDTQTAVFASAG